MEPDYKFAEEKFKVVKNYLDGEMKIFQAVEGNYKMSMDLLDKFSGRFNHIVNENFLPAQFEEALIPKPISKQFATDRKVYLEMVTDELEKIIRNCQKYENPFWEEFKKETKGIVRKLRKGG